MMTLLCSVHTSYPYGINLRENDVRNGSVYGTWQIIPCGKQTLKMTCAMVQVFAERKTVTKPITTYPATVRPKLSSNVSSRSTARISVPAVINAPPITIAPRSNRGLRPHLKGFEDSAQFVYPMIVIKSGKMCMYLAYDEEAKNLSTEVEDHQDHRPSIAICSNFTKDGHRIDTTIELR